MTPKYLLNNYFQGDSFIYPLKIQDIIEPENYDPVKSFSKIEFQRQELIHEMRQSLESILLHPEQFEKDLKWIAFLTQNEITKLENLLNFARHRLEILGNIEANISDVTEQAHLVSNYLFFKFNDISTEYWFLPLKVRMSDELYSMLQDGEFFEEDLSRLLIEEVDFFNAIGEVEALKIKLGYKANFMLISMLRLLEIEDEMIAKERDFFLDLFFKSFNKEILIYSLRPVFG
ncbi:MAG: hypothetical protein MRZ79_05360 [Bacteroidia bacterium]|nr:hypothetical protein [Bacteroidia bacterium]